jgi:predicted 2-oxoglutarate/Fe(II)-dependent dioxygenase YbiX
MTEPAYAPSSLPFAPRPGAHHWWDGDPMALPYFDPIQGHPKIVGIRRLLTPNQCRTLCEAAARIPPRRDDIAFWDSRVQTLDQLPDDEREVRALMQQTRLQIQLELIGVLRPPSRLYGDTCQLVRWDPGQGLEPHADNLEPDGSANATPHRACSAVVYLNDDYEGGETFFPGLGFRVKPEPGLAIAFGSGLGHIHGVTPIIRGQRYMMATWFTLERQHMDPAQYHVY